MAAAGLTRLVIVPVTADSRRLGVLILGLGTAGPDDLISLEEPDARPDLEPSEVELLWTIGRQAGQALERARLHEQTAAAGRARRVPAGRRAAAGRRVGRHGHGGAAGRAGRGAGWPTSASSTSSRRAGPDPAAARHRDPARQHLADEVRERHLPQRAATHPGTRALQQGGTQWVRAVDDAFLAAVTSDERHLEVARALQLTSVVAVPLMADGRRLGVLTLATDRRRSPFTAADVEVAEQLGLQVSLVLAKAQRYELDVRTSHTLQANLLPPSPPEIPGLSTAVRYLAATQGVEVGGDFYDVVRLPDDQVALAVGDVVGHDITAAATMGQLNSVYRALLVDGPSPSAMIDRLQASWSLLGLQRMATALFAALDPATGQLAIASAGHLPPLVITDGRASSCRCSRAGCSARRRRRRRRWSGRGSFRSGRRWCCSPTGWWRAGRPTSTRGSEHLLAAARRWAASDPTSSATGCWPT